MCPCVVSLLSATRQCHSDSLRRWYHGFRRLSLAKSIQFEDISLESLFKIETKYMNGYA